MRELCITRNIIDSNVTYVRAPQVLLVNYSLARKSEKLADCEMAFAVRVYMLSVWRAMVQQAG